LINPKLVTPHLEPFPSRRGAVSITAKLMHFEVNFPESENLLLKSS
jgi:hypothetical protein